jgi:hypothetical protein
MRACTCKRECPCEWARRSVESCHEFRCDDVSDPEGGGGGKKGESERESGAERWEECRGQGDGKRKGIGLAKCVLDEPHLGPILGREGGGDRESITWITDMRKTMAHTCVSAVDVGRRRCVCVCVCTVRVSWMSRQCARSWCNRRFGDQAALQQQVEGPLPATITQMG